MISITLLHSSSFEYTFFSLRHEVYYLLGLDIQVPITFYSFRQVFMIPHMMHIILWSCFSCTILHQFLDIDMLQLMISWKQGCF